MRKKFNESSGHPYPDEYEYEEILKRIKSRWPTQKRSEPQYPLRSEFLSQIVPSDDEKAWLQAQLSQMAANNVPRTYDQDDPYNLIYRELHPRELGVVVYGSNKVRPGDGQYEMYLELGRQIASKEVFPGYCMHVVDGGGDGCMEALGKGAVSAGGHAVGSAELIEGKIVGDQGHSYQYHPEFTLHPDSDSRMYGQGGYFDRAGIIMAGPGGIGTQIELANSLSKIVLNSYEQPIQKQIILIDWDDHYSKPDGFLEFLEGKVEEGTMNQSILDLLMVVKTPEEAVAQALQNEIAWTPGHTRMHMANQNKPGIHTSAGNPHHLKK